MKKVLAVFLCLLICVSLCCCKGDKIDGNDARQALECVFNKEQNFTYKSLVFDEITQENLTDFEFQTPSSAREVFIPHSYAYIDFDRDGVEELFIVDARLSYFLILRYDGEKVTGYMVDDNVDLQNVKTNGTFLTVSYIFDDFKIIGKDFYVCEVEFDGLEYRFNTLASQNHEENIYKIGEQSATKDEVEAYINNWKNSTTQIEWCNINQE